MELPFEYIKSIQAQWAWDKYCKTEWVKQGGQWILKWHLSTGGLSDHERIIDKMSKIFWLGCWVQSRRGGHYEFEVNPVQWGWKLVNDYARDKGISRQYIYHNPHKFKWIEVSKNVKFIQEV
jgi:hypothetical protein